MNARINESFPVNERSTIQKSLVLEAVCSLCNHPTSADVYEKVREKHPTISKATVYRNLDILMQKGEINRIDAPVGAARYDRNTIPHYHVRCRECGKVSDIIMQDVGDISCLVSDSYGYELTGYRIEFEGYCMECKGQLGALGD